MSGAQYDSEGRRIGAEVSTLYRPWCEACGWFGTDQQSRAAVEAEAAAHDARAHDDE